MVVDGLRAIIKKLEAGFTFLPWQGFRDDLLWKREVDLVFKLHDVPFPRAGLYYFRILSGNDLLSQRDFRVGLAKDDGPHGGGK